MLAKPATSLDSNAGAPLHPKVVEALLPLFSPSNSNSEYAAGTVDSGQLDRLGMTLGNPSSQHSAGRRARSSLQRSREQVSASIGATDSSQIIFTSSGTESIQLALRSRFEPSLRSGIKPHLITTRVEHEATLQMIEWLQSHGGSVSYLDLDAQGRPQAASFERAWNEAGSAAKSAGGIVLSAIWVNNESGVISDVRALAAEGRARGVYVHFDGAQAWGKLASLDVAKLGANAVSFSAHKIGGLAGTGVLWVDAAMAPSEGLLRGKQEQGRRGGTENLVGIVAVGAAAAGIQDGLIARLTALEKARDALEKQVVGQVGGIVVNGAGAPRVPNTLNFSIEGIEGSTLVQSLDLDGFAVSAGSACASGVPQPSHVLLALGRDERLAKASLRLSFAEPLETALIAEFTNALAAHVARMRKVRNTS